jgi:hypothetical protein
MHRFLTAFLCLSTLVMTQNVVAGTPSPLDSLEARVMAAGQSATRPADGTLSPDAVGGEVPSPATLMLFVTGLAGLSAVGSRGRTEKSIARP